MRWYTSVKQYGNNILVRGYENGQHFSEKVKYQPTLYVKSNKSSKFKSLDGFNLQPIQPGTISETRDYVDRYSDVSDFDIYGNTNFSYQYISENYKEDTIQFDLNKIKLVAIDIECASEYGFPDPKNCDEEILLISIQDYATKNVITWGSRPFNKKLKNHKYVLCKDENALLKSFLHYWQSNTPEIITGYNCETYDIPYIVGRINRTLGEEYSKLLSPWKKIQPKQIEINKGITEDSYEIYGLPILDILRLYKKYSFKRPENYRLNTIAEYELGLNKLDHDKYETFQEFYTKDWDLFVEYNVMDVELVDKLEDKTGLIQQAVTMAFMSRTNYDDVFYQVRMWDTIIYNYLLNKNIIIPQKKQSQKSEKFKGAYVKIPVSGMYDWVVSMDLTSLYPHIMMQFNIGPDTLMPERINDISVDKILNKSLDLSKYKDYSICPNGSLYRKDKKGFLSELLESMFKMRKSYKTEMLNLKKEYEINPSEDLDKKINTYSILEKSLKVCLNSCYGATGNPYFRFYDLRNAEAVTYSGQLAIRWIDKKINEYLNSILKTEGVDYVIYSDTDSAFIRMDSLVKKIFPDKDVDKVKIVNFLDRLFSEHIDKYVESSYKELGEYLNVFENKLHMKREKIAERGLWTNSQKKYIINVWDNEGVRYSKPELSFTGIEAVKSSTPAFCRSKIKEAIHIIMNSDENEIIKFIQNTKKEFMNLSVEEISFPRSVNDLDKYKSKSTIYIKGVGIQARAALLYNHYVTKNKLDKKYPLIKNGEKIKFCYLKMPNPISENVIAYIQKFPTELNLNSYVDYSTQFEKTFLSPVETILDVIGWKSKKTGTLSLIKK
jgi:DNA polymerase elongation subunit (family B)